MNEEAERARANEEAEDENEVWEEEEENEFEESLLRRLQDIEKRLTKLEQSAHAMAAST